MVERPAFGHESPLESSLLQLNSILGRFGENVAWTWKAE